MAKKKMLFEACVESYDDAVVAQKNGANRLELCSHLELDGLTPSPELIKKVCAELEIPVMVMIRPRGDGFVYSADEINIMESEITMVKSLGAAGVVFGVLTHRNRVDVENCHRLVCAAYPLPVTFHKAVDLLDDPAEGVRQLKTVSGITRILTSGGKPTAMEGAGKIREMIEAAKGKIIILVAGKVTKENVMEISRMTGADEFHGRRIVG